jgi:lysine 2,3-aminomutase
MWSRCRKSYAEALSSLEVFRTLGVRTSEEQRVSQQAQVAEPLGAEAAQPYAYRRRELVEPDWTRLPGYVTVTPAEWESAQWQRAHCVKSSAQLRAVYGDLLPESFYADLERDQAERATMSLLLPPQMVNTFVPDRVPDAEGMYADPVRRYMLPVFSDRDPEWPSHPNSTRDSLHEHEMWATEGLTHRYPTKVLAELLPTCPQYCGHCTRMDLVGNSTPLISKLKFELKPVSRYDAMIDYLRRSPSVRDVVVSGGDVANMPWKNLESFVARLLELENIRDIRLASKALMGLPQHWLADDVRAGMERLATVARARGVHLAIHTHVNAAQSVTPLVAKAAKAMLETGIRDVRNQGVLMRGVNDSQAQLLDLCFALLDEASIMPYYFYMCDMIPNAEHWRLAVREGQDLQHAIMGYLPGFATPRIVCDVPYVGKRWVHQVEEYDRERGISYWTKNYRTGIERDDADALRRRYEYFDPIATLPPEGQEWWQRHAGQAADAGHAAAAKSRTASATLITG